MSGSGITFQLVMFQSMISLVVGYLFGSIPFGVLLTRAAGLGDVRKIGSGNIGATNVLRTGHKGLAVATLLGDALKGTLAVWLMGRLMEPNGIILGMTALGAFLGHLYPAWLQFKGGKGVATFLGCLLAISPWAALVFVVVWLASAVLTRYSSLSALIASALSPVALLFLNGGMIVTVIMLGMVILLWWKHSENIKRLLAGTEGKIGQKG